MSAQEDLDEQRLARLKQRAAKHDAQREHAEAYYAKQAADERERLANVMVKGLLEHGYGSLPADLVKIGRVCYDALDADGVVFARLDGWNEK